MPACGGAWQESGLIDQLETRCRASLGLVDRRPPVVSAASGPCSDAACPGPV